MGHPLRWFLPHVVYETTIRTIQGRFLLRPSSLSRRIILGVLGRAQLLYPRVHLYAFAYLSNHAHLLVSADDGQHLAAFLGFVNGNVARELGRLHDWRGPLWGRRHRPIPILDDDALVDRLRYVIAQGTKEGLVASPRDWSGASAVPGLLGDMTLEGTWYDRNRETRARRRRQDPAPESFSSTYVVRLTPIPPWSALDSRELASRHGVLVREVERAARAEGGAVLGTTFVEAQAPHARPNASAVSRAPICHASSAGLAKRFRAALRSFVDRFRAAAAVLRKRAAVLADGFPIGSFPPRLRYVIAPIDERSPWAMPCPS